MNCYIECLLSINKNPQRAAKLAEGFVIYIALTAQMLPESAHIYRAIPC